MSVYEMKKPKRINSFSVTLFVLVLVFSYLGYWYIPVWWPIFQLQGMMKGVCNAAYHNHDDQALMKVLLKEAARTRLRLTEDNFRITRERYTPEELFAMKEGQALMEKRGKSMTIEAVYETDSELPFIGKTIHLRFFKTANTKLDTVKYDEGCG